MIFYSHVIFSLTCVSWQYISLVNYFTKSHAYLWNNYRLTTIKNLALKDDDDDNDDHDNNIIIHLCVSNDNGDKQCVYSCMINELIRIGKAKAFFFWQEKKGRE